MFLFKKQTQIQGAPPVPQRSFAWGKVAGMFFAVLAPGILLAVANAQVFPESTWLATGMVLVSVGIAGIFTVASAYATPHVRRYMLFAHLALCLVMGANLACHWVLSREVSGARQSVAERRADEDRAEERRKAAVADAERLLAAQRELSQAEARRLNAEARRNYTARQLGLSVSPSFRRAAPPQAPISLAPVIPELPHPAESSPVVTVEQVMAKWNPRLIYFAIADFLVSLVAFGIALLLWEWDKDGDGVPDHRQRQTDYQALGAAYTAAPQQIGFSTNSNPPHP